MTVYKHVVKGEAVTVQHLPPQHAEPLWEKWLRHVEDNENGVIGVDVETTAIDEILGPFEPSAKLRMIQFGSRRYAFALDPHDEFWRPRIVALLNSYDGDGYRFVSHTNYDPLWAHREFGTPIDDRFIDTMPMASLLFPGVTSPKGLKDLDARFVGCGLLDAETALTARFRELAPVGSRVGKTLKAWGFTNIPLDDEVFGLYGGLDAIGVRRLLDVFNGMLRRSGMAKLSRREQTIQRVASRMRVKGLRVDLEWTENLIREIEDEYVGAEARLVETFGFAAKSPKRGEWLAAKGVEFVEFTPTGQPKLTMPSASAQGTLPDLTERYKAHKTLGPVFADMLTLGLNSNILSNLKIVRASAANDGHVHPEIKTQAAHTGRMSIIRPAMQTFKKRDPRLRGCFVAREGMVLVSADYDSQEIRIAAAYSRDELLLKIVRGGLNQHVETAVMIFGERYVDKSTVMDEITGKTFYDASKTLDFAQQYGAGPSRIGDQLGYKSRIDEEGRRRAHPRARAMWQAWRDAYAGLVAWSEQMAKARNIVNPWGRVIPADRWRPYANANYCVAPGTPILTSDLRHVPAESIQAGQRLVGFDEDTIETRRTNRWGGPHKTRHLRVATVVGTSRVTKRTVRVTAGGRSVLCSDDHLWLALRKHAEPSTRWVAAKDLTSKDQLLSLGVWEEDRSFGAGWLSGLYDGEGCLSSRSEGHRQTSLTFSQLPGRVLGRFCQEMGARDFECMYREPVASSTSPCATVQTSGVRHIMKILGVLRPERFAHRFEAFYEGTTLVGGVTENMSVESVEYVGEMEHVSIETDTHTLVANGFLSHNCIQSTGRDILGDAIVNLIEAGWGDYLWLFVHDEIVLEVPEELAEQACEALAVAMATELKGVPITATPSITGPRWGADKE